MSTRNFVPRAHEEGNIGTALKNWLKGWFKDLFVSGNLTDGSDTITISEIKDSVTEKHTRQHAINSSLDHTSSVTAGKMLKADVNGLGAEATNTDTEVANAVTKKHAASGQFNQATSGEIAGLTEKTVPVITDLILIEDSAATNVKKKVQIGNLPSITYYYAESLGESSTTSTYPTYVNKLTLNVTPVAGTYILEWDCQLANSTANSDNWVKIYSDSTIFSESQFRSQSIAYANSGWTPRGGFIKLTLTAVNMNFYIDFCRVANTTYIKNAKLLLRRIA